MGYLQINYKGLDMRRSLNYVMPPTYVGLGNDFWRCHKCNINNLSGDKKCAFCKKSRTELRKEHK